MMSLSTSNTSELPRSFFEPRGARGYTHSSIRVKALRFESELAETLDRWRMTVSGSIRSSAS